MKKKYFITLVLFIISYNVFSQSNYSKLDGIWEFVPLKSNEATFKIFSLFKKNKQLDITFWKRNNSIDTDGTPFTYFGFWDTNYFKEGSLPPKNVKDLKPTGKYIFFYDDLIIPKQNENNIGYDSLGNLYQPTRICQWVINEDLPEGLPPTTLSLYFNMEPDVYKKIESIPWYVLKSLKNNKNDWKRYLDFIGHEEKKITAQKSIIHSAPNKPTKMYLIKGDEVECLEEKGEWYKIRYYGKKTIEGWVKKSEVGK